MITVVEEQPVVRVERGRIAEDELAALVAVLLTRAAGTDRARAVIPVVPLWNRPERNAPYRSPASWRR
ncbi:acyl-CoA carboxylase subunit epsilon [Streptomyces spinosirectus]